MAYTQNNLEIIFAHLPLPDAATHIRLLEIDADGGLDGRLSVIITTVAMSTAPPYHAISYTWGDPVQQEKVFVRHHLHDCGVRSEEPRSGVMVVRSNCVDVLRQLEHFAIAKHYWIDAICIDQSDLQEKNMQVAKMGAKFKQADAVLSCIGMHDESSRFLTDLLSIFDRDLAENGTSTSILTHRLVLDKAGSSSTGIQFVDEATTEEELKDREFLSETCYNWLQGLDDSTFERLHTALERLTRRPYFWRIWTLQEIWAAKYIRIFCGYDELSLPTLLFWWREWKAPQYRSPNAKKLRLWMYARLDECCPARSGEDHTVGISGFDLAYENLLYERQYGPQVRPVSSSPQLDLWGLYNMCEHRECQDRRDAVYGTLLLAEWRKASIRMPDGIVIHDETTIVPDYAQSAFDLAKSLMGRISTFDTVTPSEISVLCDLLRLGIRDQEVRDGIALRSQTISPTTFSSHARPWHGSINTQKFVKHTENGIQLGSDTGFPIRRIIEGSTYPNQVYRVSNSHGELYAITCADTRPGDWLVRIKNKGASVILRRKGQYFMIIGRAYCSSKFAGDRVSAAFTIWFGVDDIVIFLVCAKEEDHSSSSLVESSERIIEWCRVKFCAEEGSSFAMLTGEENIPVI